MRPQHPGYMNFQDTATGVAHDAVAGRLSCREAAGAINRIAAGALA